MPVWRPARPDDDAAIVSMSLELYHHAPPPEGVSATQVRATLERFRHEAIRGCALILDDGGIPAGYALLVSFWSNELGGEICTIDELFVADRWRSQGYGGQLVAGLRSGGPLWPRRPVALELEVSPANVRARALYERLGFQVKRNATLRLDMRDQQA
jgi:ribosomal protein S18 acetylase RimI-like enzyme